VLVTGLDVDQIVEKLLSDAGSPRTQAVWRGDFSPFGGDRSAALFHLINRAIFYCGRDPAKIEAVVRRCDALYSEKWETPSNGRTWIQDGIRRALERYDGAIYDPQRRRRAELEYLIAEPDLEPPASGWPRRSSVARRT
jgi:hypothetical protein